MLHFRRTWDYSAYSEYISATCKEIELAVSLMQADEAKTEIFDVVCQDHASNQ